MGHSLVFQIQLLISVKHQSLPPPSASADIISAPADFLVSVLLLESNFFMNGRGTICSSELHIDQSSYGCSSKQYSFNLLKISFPFERHFSELS